MTIPTLLLRERKDVRLTTGDSGENRQDACLIDEEEYVARSWWSLAPDTVLPLAHGGTCRVLFTGYPGSAAGPDVRDAVLIFDFPDTVSGERIVGDVEFHVRSSDWVTHQHHTDSRYNAVLLHVVLQCDTPSPTCHQDGTIVPVCSLYDSAPSLFPLLQGAQDAYPCQYAMAQRSGDERQQVLRRAGVLRFEQKIHAFVEEIHALLVPESSYHLCLIPALAEGLAYGRDRAFFRAVALRLLGLSHALPEPLGRATSPAPLDAVRLTVIRTLVEQGASIWSSLYALLHKEGKNTEATLQALREWLNGRGVSAARADILLCNVILPFMAAIALIERDEALGKLALQLYKAHPGLTSNRITRMMTAQLGLGAEPRGACTQQGLHYIYQQTCRAKLCEECIAGREQL